MSDPIEVVMEEALRPGRYISELASFSLVNELQSAAARIAEADPERAVGLYETFIAPVTRRARRAMDKAYETLILARIMTGSMRKSVVAATAAVCCCHRCGPLQY